MVEKADGSDANENAKPSMLARILRFGRNGISDNGPTKIAKRYIGRPQLISSTSLLPDDKLSISQPTPAAPVNLTSNTGPGRQRAPDLQKPLPALPQEMTVERNTVRPADMAIRSDQAAASRIPPRIDHPDRANFEANAAETSPKVVQRPETHNAPPIRRLGSRLPNIPEGANHIAGRSEPPIVVDRPLAPVEKATEIIDVKAVRAAAMEVRLKAAKRHGVTLPPADGAVKIDQAAVLNTPPRINNSSRENFEVPASVSSAKGSQRSGVGNAPGIHRLGSSLVTIKEEPEHVADISPSPLPVDRPVASAESRADNVDPIPGRRPLQSFLAETEGANPSGRGRLASFLASTAGARAQIADKSQIATDRPVASAENQAGNPTSKPSRDVPQSLITKGTAGEEQQAVKPPSSRGLDTQRRDSDRRSDNGRG